MFGYNNRYSLFHPWHIVSDSYKRIKWFIQRGYRGYADCDVWSLDYYLDTWMPDALSTLKRNKLGYPVGLTPKKWAAILDTMIKGFKANRKLCNIEFKTVKQHRALKKIVDKGLYLFAKHYGSLWD